MKKIVAIVSLVFVISCGPNAKEIPTDIELWKNDDFASEIQKLDEEDRSAMAKWMIRTAMLKEFRGTNVPEGMTIGKAIAEQKEFDKAAAAEAAVEAETIKAKELANSEVENEMRSVAKVTVTQFMFDLGEQIEYAFDDRFLMSMDITNIGVKNITAIKGSIAVTNAFDEHIKTFSLVIDNTIPGSPADSDTATKITWSGEMDINQFDEGDNILKTSDPAKLKFLWKPVAIVFDDGTKMEAP